MSVVVLVGPVTRSHGGPVSCRGIYGASEALSGGQQPGCRLVVLESMGFRPAGGLSHSDADNWYYLVVLIIGIT